MTDRAPSGTPSGATPDLAIHWTAPAEEEGARAVFSAAFGGTIPPALWSWKYAPSDSRSMVAVRDGRVVAHYGGQARRLLLPGGGDEVETAMHVSDIMVHPSQRAAFHRGGVFAQITAAFTAAVTRPGGPHAFMFGFPSPRAHRLGEMLGLYARIDSVDQLVWPPLQAAASGPRGGWGHRLRGTRVVPIGLDEVAAHADRLWDRQRRGLPADPVVVVRDSAFVTHRFVGHPTIRYHGLGLIGRWRRHPCAVAIFAEVDDLIEIIDFLGDPDRLAPLVTALQRMAGQRGLSAVICRATPALIRRLPPPERQEPLLPVTIAGADPVAIAARLSGRCWMTAGDTDYR